jgi:hypothetical protein
MPEYAAARNLSAVTRPLLATGRLDAASAGELGRELVGALALAPSDGIVIANLDRLYQLYEEQPAWSPYAKPELSQRIEVVKALRAGTSAK